MALKRKRPDHVGVDQAAGAASRVVAAGEVVGTQIVVGLVAVEHVEDRHEDALFHRDECFGVAEPWPQAVAPGAQVGVLDAGSWPLPRDTAKRAAAVAACSVRVPTASNPTEERRAGSPVSIRSSAIARGPPVSEIGSYDATANSPAPSDRAHPRPLQRAHPGSASLGHGRGAGTSRERISPANPARITLTVPGTADWLVSISV